jgi:hypothetical protein
MDVLLCCLRPHHSLRGVTEGGGEGERPNIWVVKGGENSIVASEEVLEAGEGCLNSDKVRSSRDVVFGRRSGGE